MAKVSKKHQLFVDEWLKCFNGTKAYMAVYPEAAYDSARAASARLLADSSISTLIADRLAAAHMTADEALKLLADQARGDIGEVMDISGMGFSLDMAKAKELGLTKIIKKVKQKTTTYIAKKESEEDREVTELEIELYDSQAALDKILRVHGKYNDKVDVTSNGETILKRTAIDADKL